MELVRSMTELAGQLLQADPGSVNFENGWFKSSDHATEISMSQLAGEHARSGKEPMESVFVAEEAPMTFPHGCHICELEIDEETGTVNISDIPALMISEGSSILSCAGVKCMVLSCRVRACSLIA